MAKRQSGTGQKKPSKSHKTQKRREVKRQMLAKKAIKKAKKRKK